MDEAHVANGTFTVYVTKYALTDGILVCEGEMLDNSASGRGVQLKGKYHSYAWNATNPGGKKEWFLDKEEALAYAEEMRTKKIASLEKQIERLRAKKIRIVACDG